MLMREKGAIVMDIIYYLDKEGEWIWKSFCEIKKLNKNN